MNIATRRQIK